MKRLFSTLFDLLILVFPLAGQKPVRDLKPTVILISVDGFRYDYFEKYKPENLNNLARKGVRARWMIPAYPSLTFPNHYTVATGLYPENHGIVGNTIYDPEFDAIFALSKREEVQNGRWWGGEPIWVTAEKQGQRAAAFFFPGTEAEIAGKRPTFWKEFDDKFPNPERVDQILKWLDLPAAERPTFYTLYFSDVDHAGHDFSPDSPEVGKAINNVDDALGRLIDGLKARRIFGKNVNLIIVSDHGMAVMNPTKAVILDDYFDLDTAVIAWSGQLVNIFPKNETETEKIYAALKAKPMNGANCYRKAEFPARFHYQNSRRIAPVVCLAEDGWFLTSRDKFDAEKARAQAVKNMKGAHGYDNNLESMRAIFVGHGAAFKKKIAVEPFENVHVYNIMTKILGLTPAPNDGNMKAAQNVLK